MPKRASARASAVAVDHEQLTAAWGWTIWSRESDAEVVGRLAGGLARAGRRGRLELVLDMASGKTWCSPSLAALKEEGRGEGRGGVARVRSAARRGSI